MPEASAPDSAAGLSLTWTLDKDAAAPRADDDAAPASSSGRLPQQLYVLMAATSFTTWAILAGGYQLLFA